MCVCVFVSTGFQIAVFGLKDGLRVSHTALEGRLRTRVLREQGRDVCLIWDDFTNSTWNKLRLETVSSPSQEVFKHNRTFMPQECYGGHPAADWTFNLSDLEFHLSPSL